MLTFIFWFLIVNLSAMAIFGCILIYDRIKYGVWASEYPKAEDDYHDSP